MTLQAGAALCYPACVLSCCLHCDAPAYLGKVAQYVPQHTNPPWLYPLSFQGTVAETCAYLLLYCKDTAGAAPDRCAVHAGLLFAGMAVISLVGIMPASFVADKLGRKWTIVPSCLGLAASLLLMALTGAANSSSWCSSHCTLRCGGSGRYMQALAASRVVHAADSW